MKSKKLFKIISLVVALCMVFSLTAFAGPKNNLEDNDEDENDDAKEFVIKSGVIKGYGNDDFGWEDYVKRGDLTLMIVRAFHLSMINKGNFEDINNEDYYYDAIATAKAHGIAKGDGRNFNPKKYVTIGEAILLIERSAKVANSNVVVNTNVDLDTLYDADDQKEYATREQIAHMLYLVFPVNGEVDDSDEDEDIIEFTVEKDKDNVTFGEDSIDDFKNVFDIMIDNEDEDENDKELDYIKITSPSTAQGKLYYDYEDKELVTSSTKLFLDDEDEILLEDVTFVPNVNYSGTFYLEYEAFDQADDEDESDVRLYKGLIKITVVRDEETAENLLDTITYRINDNDYEVAEFVKADFNDDLDSVTFKIPAIAEGKLYFKYDTASQDTVANNDKFDYAELSDITFVPNSDFVGTMYIDYTAVDGDKDYTGKIKIVVKDKYDIELMTIEAAKGSTITFDGDDFDDAFENSTVYSTFEHVVFELIDTDYGTLKYNNDVIDADDDFIQAELDDVSLDLNDSNEDTFLINYTVHEDGKEFDGAIKVIIEQ